MPLCSYDASMSDIRTLAFACASEFHTILRCVAGGRDHSSCCSKRGVTDACLDVCTGKVPDSLKNLAENCLPFIGNIVQCFEEGEYKEGISQFDWENDFTRFQGRS